MTSKAIYYVLHLITLPDVEMDGHKMHRIVFNDLEICQHIATTLGQERDPWARKDNCTEVTEFYKEVQIPIQKPEEID